MRTIYLTPYILLCVTILTPALAAVTPHALHKTGRTAVLECNVDGEESPEAALRQVDAHALMSMYCATGCDHAVNHATPHAYSTYIKPRCWVEKDEQDVVHKKFKAKDDKDDKKRRDIDAYTVGSATLRFSCTDQNGVDYTEAAARRIGLELSICKRRS